MCVHHVNVNFSLWKHTDIRQLESRQIAKLPRPGAGSAHGLADCLIIVLMKLRYFRFDLHLLHIIFKD